MKIPLNISCEALADLFLISNAYGAFLKEREIVKRFIKENKEAPESISSKIIEKEKCDYHYGYDDTFQKDGLSESDVKELTELIRTTFDSQTKSLTKSLISTEKYYKKLKHQFIEKHPHLESTLHSFVKQNCELVESHKRRQYHNNDAVINMSERFIAYLQISSGGSDGQNLAITQFFSSIRKKYSIELNNKRYDELADIFEVYNSKKIPTKMSIEDIDLLAGILKRQLESVTEYDLNDVRAYISSNNGDLENKEKIVREILKNHHERCKKLLEDYSIVKLRSLRILHAE